MADRKPVKCYLSKKERDILDILKEKTESSRSSVLRNALLYLARVTENVGKMAFIDISD